MIMVEKRQAGFTIVELLVATVVFSSVLILITVGVLTFTKVYYKGINQSKTQTAARTVIETIGQSIQFSGGAVTVPNDASPNGSKRFCVADTRFSYLPGWQLVVGDAENSLNQSKHALVVDEPGNCAGLPAQDMRSNGQLPGAELLAPGMRISKLSLKQIGATDSYSLTVKVIYGDNDLVYSPSGKPEGAAAEDATCRFGFSGSQFCAAAELSTIVNKRINQTQ